MLQEPTCFAWFVNFLYVISVVNNFCFSEYSNFLLPFTLNVWLALIMTSLCGCVVGQVISASLSKLDVHKTCGQGSQPEMLTYLGLLLGQGSILRVSFPHQTFEILSHQELP